MEGKPEIGKRYGVVLIDCCVRADFAATLVAWTPTNHRAPNEGKAVFSNGVTAIVERNGSMKLFKEEVGAPMEPHSS